MTTIPFACHTAYLDVLHGVGVLVMPAPDDDLRMPGAAASLQESDYAAALRKLDELGWEPLENEEDGGWTFVGVTADGRELASLYAREAIVSGVSLEELARAEDELCTLAGVVQR